MSPVAFTTPRPMSSAVALSLALHLAAFQLPDWSAAAPVPPLPPALEVRVIPPDRPPPTPPPARPTPSPKPTTTSRAEASLLAGGGAMSDEADDAVSQTAVPRPAALAQASQAAPSNASPQRTAGGAQAAAGESVTARGQPVAASRQLASSTWTTPQRGARVGESGGSASGEAGGGVSGGGAQARGSLAQAAATGSGAPRPGVTPAAAGIQETGGQRIDLAHAQTGKAQLAESAGASRGGGSQTPSRGGETSAPVGSARHAGPPRETGGQVILAGVTALDPSALDNAPSNRLFHAALAADGAGCFKYTTRMRRLRLSGLVILRVQVNREGRAERIEVRKGSGDSGLDALALEQAQGCARFLVNNRRGQPVAATLDLPIRYRMHDDEP